MKPEIRKLVLARETLNRMTSPELRKVQGGMMRWVTTEGGYYQNPYTSLGCDTCTGAPTRDCFCDMTSVPTQTR